VTANDALADFLLGRGDPPPAEVLRGARLASYACTVLPPDHPLRSELRPHYLAALLRHQQIRAELVPLLSAWQGAGVDVLLFKGFYLAEFVYPDPGGRFYGDVDVLIRPAAVVRAAAIASQLGWVPESRTSSAVGERAHVALGLFRPDGASILDVHRFVIQSSHRSWSRAPRRITEAVWEAAESRQWEGTVIWTPRPVDSLLVGLILQRSWADRWAIKPHDPVDFRYLRDRAGVSRDELRARAAELRCERTLSRFLDRCDPDAQRLLLRPPSKAEQLSLDLSVGLERAPREIERLVSRLDSVLYLLVDIPRAVPALLKVVRARRREHDIRALLQQLTPSPPSGRAPSVATRVRTVRALRWLTRLLPLSKKGHCLPRSLAIYYELRRQGWPVSFKTGVRRGGEGILGHAWVELDGRVLPELLEPGVSAMYAESFRYPPRAATAGGEGGWSPAGVAASPPG
jgi:hypothetical protein